MGKWQTRWLLLAAALQIGATTPRTHDWRAMMVYGHDLAFVDADLARRSDDRLVFQAVWLPTDADTAGDRGYDRRIVRGEASCASGGSIALKYEESFLLKGKPVDRPGWLEPEDVAEDRDQLLRSLCDGSIGYRSFASPDEGLIEFRKTQSLAHLTASWSRESRLVGIVSEGFEKSVVSLCGSEAGCAPDADWETCWIDDGSGATSMLSGTDQSETTATPVGFRGRVLRSPTGKGFGHMGAYACAVQVIGEMTQAALPARPAPLGPAAVAPPGDGLLSARKDLDEIVTQSGGATFESARGKITIDRLSLARPGPGDNCYSEAPATTRFPLPEFIHWGIVKLSLQGARIELVDEESTDDTRFDMEDVAGARRLIATLEPLIHDPLSSLDQKGPQLHLTFSSGRHAELFYATSAAALRSAGILGGLRSLEIARLKRDGNTAVAFLTRRRTLNFDDSTAAGAFYAKARVVHDRCNSPEER